MTRRKKRRRPTVGFVRSFLKEIFGEYIANILVQETIGFKPEDHELTDGEVKSLIKGIDELFGGFGDVLYGLMELEE